MYFVRQLDFSDDGASSRKVIKTEAGQDPEYFPIPSENIAGIHASRTDQVGCTLFFSYEALADALKYRTILETLVFVDMLQQGNCKFKHSRARNATSRNGDDRQ